MNRSRLTSISLGIGLLAAFWAAVLAVFGGIDVRVLGLHITSNEPERPALLALGAFIVAASGYGPSRTLVLWTAVTARVRDGWLIALLTVGSLVLGVRYGATAVGGSDSYGYASEAEGWLTGTLKQPQPWAEQVPWPSAAPTFAPLAYNAIEVNGHIENVPVVSPGLPLMMAAAKFVGGQRAMFLVGPVLGSLLVLATWGLGCRLGASRAGVVAAGCVATSPVFLNMLLVPMSDAAGAALWGGAFFFLFGGGAAAAAIAGALTALAVLVRPNLLYLAVLMGLWFFVRQDPSHRGFRHRLGLALCFGIPALAGPIILLLIFQHLYGSWALTGYGSVGAAWYPKNFFVNARIYLAAFVRTGTPLVLLGVAALFAPLRRIWPGVPDRRMLGFMGLAFIAVVAQYCVYIVLRDWQSLRFFLPVWPFVMLGLASLVCAIAARGPLAGIVMTALVIGLGIHNLRFAAREFVFDLWRGHRRIAAAAVLVREMTEPNSVVLAVQHSGSVRYYAGRVTIRYDQMDPAWLDRGVAWLHSHGAHVYALFEQFEVDEARKLFAGQETITHLDRPLLLYNPPSGLALFDLSGAPPDAPRVVEEQMADGHRAIPPAPPPSLRFTP